MKIASKPTGFQPLTVTFESPAEAALITAVLGPLNDPDHKAATEREYPGIKVSEEALGSNFRLYCALSEQLKNAGFQFGVEPQ